MNQSRLRVGLLVNPWAGIGGPAGLRGSDGPEIRDSAVAHGSVPRAGERAGRCLAALAAQGDRFELVCWGGPMGADVARAAGLVPRVCGEPASDPSTREDTLRAARGLADAGIDLLLFAGGDGTARDVCDAIGTRVPALGIPAGVKMYSGVFAVSPEAAADIVQRLLEGRPVTVEEAEVRDIDEEAFRRDRVQSRHYGELRVPGVRGYVQHVKCGRREDEAIERQEIGAGVVAQMDDGVLYLIGTGTTPKAVLDELGLVGALLGVDAVVDRRLVASDLDAAGVCALLEQYPSVRLVITATGGQGFVLGRGNQQLSAEAIRRIGIGNILLVATRSKLDAMEGRPLLVDTGDRELDHALAGLRPVLTGYGHSVLYRVAAADSPA